jgi:hypothetical protein
MCINEHEGWMDLGIALGLGEEIASEKVNHQDVLYEDENTEIESSIHSNKEDNEKTVSDQKGTSAWACTKIEEMVNDYDK